MRTKLGISAAIVSTMAAAATAYMYMGKDAPQRRKKVAAWMRKAEKDIVREALKLKDAAFTEENFGRIVDTVTKKYREAQNLSADDIGRFVAMIAEGWQSAGQRGSGGVNSREGTGERRTRRPRSRSRARGRNDAKETTTP